MKFGIATYAVILDFKASKTSEIPNSLSAKSLEDSESLPNEFLILSIEFKIDNMLHPHADEKNLCPKLIFFSNVRQ